MNDGYGDHPLLTIFGGILVLIIFIGGLCVLAIYNHNEQVTNANEQYTWAIVDLGNGELLEGQVTSWKDVDESDMIQFTMNNKTYLTHSSKVILSTEKP